MLRFQCSKLPDRVSSSSASRDPTRELYLKFEVGTRKPGMTSPGEESFLHEVKADLRPYLRALLVDFVISACLWLCLYAFQGLTLIFPIQGFEGATVIAVHSASTTLAFATFGLKFTYDVIAISGRRSH